MSKELTLQDRLQSDRFKSHLMKVLPKGVEIDRHLAVALDQIRTSLNGGKEYAPMSIINAVYTAGTMGLSFNPNAKEAYLVPFGKMITLIPGYRGLMKLCKNAGMQNMTSKVIYANDSFDFEENDGVVTYHYSPCFEEQKGDPICVLTVATMKDGTKDIRVMEWFKVMKIKNAAKSKNIWNQHTEEMAQKTAIRKHCNQLPQSFDDVNLQSIIRMDEMMDAGKPVFDTPMALKDMEDEGYEELVAAQNNQEERKSTKPVVSQPVIVDEPQTPNMDKLVELTGQRVEELSAIFEKEFKITDIEKVKDKVLSNVVDYFTGVE